MVLLILSLQRVLSSRGIFASFYCRNVREDQVCHKAYSHFLSLSKTKEGKLEEEARIYRSVKYALPENVLGMIYQSHLNCFAAKKSVCWIWDF